MTTAIKFPNGIRNRLRNLVEARIRPASFPNLLGGDDEAELVVIFAAPIKKGWPIRYIAVSRLDLAPLTVAGDAIAFKIAQMRVHGLGADKLPSARTIALRVELHYPRLHRHLPGFIVWRNLTPNDNFC